MSEPRVGGFAAAGALVAVFAITFAAAAVGGLASVKSVSFYGALDRPSWAPSAAVFGPVWTVLYTMMAFAAFLVVRRLGWREALLPMTAYVVQLALNAAWTWLFFAWRRGGVAFAEILLLAATVAFTIVLFWRVRPLAGALLLPYLGWVCFAAALTWALWRSNGGVLG